MHKPSSSYFSIFPEFYMPFLRKSPVPTSPQSQPSRCCTASKQRSGSWRSSSEAYCSAFQFLPSARSASCWPSVDTTIYPWTSMDLHGPPVTLWLCQNSYWKWPFIVDFPIKNGEFSIAMLVHQRVPALKMKDDRFWDCRRETTWNITSEAGHQEDFYSSHESCWYRVSHMSHDASK